MSMAGATLSLSTCRHCGSSERHQRSLGAHALRNRWKSARQPRCGRRRAKKSWKIVKFALSEKLAVVASGARTKLGMGMPPRQYDLAVDMTRLARVTAYDPQDLTLGVESGISLREITNLLAEHRQFLPLAVPFADRATVGGTVAPGVDGPLRQFYGTARDYVLGMEFVTGEGVLAKSGGRVVKNVSGYDIHKVMIGALGTLGNHHESKLPHFPAPGIHACFGGRIQERERRN